MNGRQVKYYENGQKKLEYTLVDDKKHGLYQRWYESGQKEKECSYVNGKKVGICQEWHPSGDLYLQCSYMDGQLEGLYEMWEYFYSEEEGKYILTKTESIELLRVQEQQQE